MHVNFEKRTSRTEQKAPMKHHYSRSTPHWVLAPLLLASLAAQAQSQPSGRHDGRWFREIPDIMDATPGHECASGIAPLRQGNGMSVRLNVGYSEQKIYNPNTDRFDRVKLRTYNGCSQGPVVNVRPGNKLKVDLRNTLPATEPTFDCPDDDGLTEHHRPHCFNTVNLHTHGLHVSPSGKSDNVLISIHPGQRFQYEYDIPRNHPAGTHWYHAHRHGATAIQVASGGAGVLIVRGDRKVQDKHRNGGVADIDTVLKDFRGRPLREQVMLFQQIEYACFDGPTSINPLQDPVTFESTCGASQVGEIRSYDTQMRFTRDPRAGRAGFTSTWDISGRYTSINGVVQPVLPKRGDQIVAGEIQRWRLVHGGVRDSINLKIVKIDPTALAAANVRDPEALVDRAMQRMRGARSKGAQQIELTNLCRGEVVKQVEFALDGHTRSAMSEKAVSSMHPGQRSDLLVAFPSAGLYCVLDEAADAASTINFRPDQPGKAKDRRLLAFARVSDGPGVPDLKPDGLGHTKYWHHVRHSLLRANPDLPPAVRRDLAELRTPEYAPIKDIPCPRSGCGSRLDEYTISFNPVTAQLGFGINGKPYLGTRMDYQPVLGRTDEWTIAGGAAHIFHVHVNPVQIVDVIKEVRGPSPGPGQAGPLLGLVSIYDRNTGTCKPEFQVPDAGAIVGEDVTQYCDQLGTIRDTVFQKGGYRLVLRTKFEDYTGLFVMHCHILDHEDEGMMMNVNIVSPTMAMVNQVSDRLQASLIRVESTLEKAGILAPKRQSPNLPPELCVTPPTASNPPARSVSVSRLPSLTSGF